MKTTSPTLEPAVNIRPFRSGDEAVQAEIYNAAAAPLPYFKPATTHEIQRRTRGRDFDPNTRFYAEVDGKVVGYATFHPNGRLSYPWCLAGHGACAAHLFDRVLETMRGRGIRRGFAAYRPDWPQVHDFFLAQGFHKAREVMNFFIDLVDMPTPSARVVNTASPVTCEDIPAILSMCPEALRVSTAEELERHLLKNPYFGTSAVFSLRSRSDNTPVGVGVLISEPTFANPRAVDANMPCYRLGAFGSETMATKRMNGVFSFLARADANVYSVGMELMGQASFRLRDNDDVDCLAAQCGSDVPGLLAFYQRNFRLQGKFPVFEMDLNERGS
jgi:hypothetical protein